MNAEESQQLNADIDSASDGDNHKPIAYIGWFWREVDFTQPFSLGHIPADKEGENGYTGFMESNKWDYCSFTPPDEQQKQIIEFLLLHRWVEASAYMQAITPPEIAKETRLTHAAEHGYR